MKYLCSFFTIYPTIIVYFLNSYACQKMESDTFSRLEKKTYNPFRNYFVKLLFALSN